MYTHTRTHTHTFTNQNYKLYIISRDTLDPISIHVVETCYLNAKDKTIRRGRRIEAVTDKYKRDSSTRREGERSAKPLI